MSQSLAEELARTPFMHIDFLERSIDVERRPDGVVILRQRTPLGPTERCIPAYLARWAKERPDQVWLAQRRGPERAWKKITYAEAKRDVDALTQALLDLKLTPDRPVAILSGNSIEHALLTQAAMQAGIPAAPVSPAYSLMSQDHAKLRYIFDLIRPGVVMVQDGVVFERALKALDLTGVTVIHVDRAPESIASVAWSSLVATRPTEAVERAIAAVGPKTVGKLLFTSGSTGMPKAVINTHGPSGRLLCGVLLGALLSRFPQSARMPKTNLFAGLLFTLLVIVPWWLALSKAGL